MFIRSGHLQCEPLIYILAKEWTLQKLYILADGEESTASDLQLKELDGYNGLSLHILWIFRTERFEEQMRRERSDGD